MLFEIVNNYLPLIDNQNYNIYSKTLQDRSKGNTLVNFDRFNCYVFNFSGCQRKAVIWCIINCFTIIKFSILTKKHSWNKTPGNCVNSTSCVTIVTFFFCLTGTNFYSQWKFVIWNCEQLFTIVWNLKFGIQNYNNIQRKCSGTKANVSQLNCYSFNIGYRWYMLQFQYWWCCVIGFCSFLLNDGNYWITTSVVGVHCLAIELMMEFHC